MLSSIFGNKKSQLILARVYQDTLDPNKIHSEYYGDVGEVTDLRDIHGATLHVGDIVVGKDNYRNLIVKDVRSNVYFAMGLRNDPNSSIHEWRLKKTAIYLDLKLGDKINDMYVIEGKPKQKYTKEEILKTIENKDIDLNTYRNKLITMLKNT